MGRKTFIRCVTTVGREALDWCALVSLGDGDTTSTTIATIRVCIFFSSVFMPFFLFTINDYQDLVSSVRIPARGLRFDTRWPWAHRSSDNDRLAECCSTNKHKDSTIVSPTCERHVQLPRVSFQSSRVVSFEMTLHERPCFLVFFTFLIGIGMSTRIGTTNLTNSHRASTLQHPTPSMNPCCAEPGPFLDRNHELLAHGMLQSMSNSIVIAGRCACCGSLNMR